MQTELFRLSLAPVIPTPEITLEDSDNDQIAHASAADHFGQVDIDGGKTDRTFTIRNTGTAPLDILSIAVSGANADEFVADGLAIPSIVPVGAIATFQVTFDPVSEGVRTAVVNIGSSDPIGNPHSFTVAGMGLNVISVIQPNTGDGASPPFNEEGQFQLTFEGEAGVSYRVDYSDSLNGTWTLLPLIDGDGAATQVTDITSQNEPNRFYRVSVIPQ